MYKYEYKYKYTYIYTSIPVQPVQLCRFTLQTCLHFVLMKSNSPFVPQEWARGKLEVGDSTEPLQSDFFPRVTDPTEIERLWRELLGPDERPVKIIEIKSDSWGMAAWLEHILAIGSQPNIVVLTELAWKSLEDVETNMESFAWEV